MNITAVIRIICRSIMATLLALGFTQTAMAQVMVYLDDGEPAFWLTYPDGWDIRTPRSEDRDLISAMPADGSILWQGAWIVRDSTSIEEAADRLVGMEKGLFKDVKLTRAPWDENVAPLVARCNEGTGLYKDTEEVRFRICVFEFPGNRVGALAYMGKPDAIDSRQGELDAMISSLEAVE